MKYKLFYLPTKQMVDFEPPSNANYLYVHELDATRQAVMCECDLYEYKIVPDSDALVEFTKLVTITTMDHNFRLVNDRFVAGLVNDHIVVMDMAFKDEYVVEHKCKYADCMMYGHWFYIFDGKTDEHGARRYYMTSFDMASRVFGERDALMVDIPLTYSAMMRATDSEPFVRTHNGCYLIFNPITKKVILYLCVCITTFRCILTSLSADRQ